MVRSSQSENPSINHNFTVKNHDRLIKSYPSFNPHILKTFHDYDMDAGNTIHAFNWFTENSSHRSSFEDFHGTRPDLGGGGVSFAGKYSLLINIIL